MRIKEHKSPADHHLQHIFADHGLRCTRQRRVLYEALCATKAHPTADQLYHDVSETDQSISLATVYNTLEAFCRVGLAQKLPGNGTSARFDAAVHDHLHLRDTTTGRMVDAPDDLSQLVIHALPKEVIRQLEERMGFEIDQIQVELVGKFKRR